MGTIQSFVAFFGRALLSLIFISSAIHQLLDWEGAMQSFNQALTDRLTISVGNDFIQEVVEWSLAHAFSLLLAACIFELVGGVLVFLGLWVRLGALLLIFFLVPATLLFHNFWDVQGMDRQMQMIHFMKNVSISGGLFFLLAIGKGKKLAKSHDKPI